MNQKLFTNRILYKARLSVKAEGRSKIFSELPDLKKFTFFA